MNTLEDISIYLPKYLSVEAQDQLFAELKNFPENIDQRLYTIKLVGEENVFQGDGLENLLMVNLSSNHIGNAKCMILSNTCDIDDNNDRFFPSRICYSPIFSFEKYKDSLVESQIYENEQIEKHLESIRKQRISQIFYLPETKTLGAESIVFFDRVVNCNNNSVDRHTLKDYRLFTLSDFGLYLFLLKLSIHFTRIQEGVDRGQHS